jgi:hypothetical protein
MRRQGWIFLGIVLVADCAPFGAFAQKIDDGTRCADVIAIITIPQPDKQQVLAIEEYIKSLFNLMDTSNVGQGDPAVIAPMSEQGRNNAVDSAMAGCGEHPANTLRESTVQVYEHLKDVRRAMGVDPGK